MTTTNTQTETGIFEDASDRFRAPIELREKFDINSTDDSVESVLLDRLASTIGWTFLYLPGIAAIHFCVLLQSLFAAQGQWPPHIVAGTGGAVIVGAFMMMLGLGKMSDLRYLKTVGAALASSILLAVVYTLFSLGVSTEYFGWFASLTLAITMLITYFVKEKLDREETL